MLSFSSMDISLYQGAAALNQLEKWQNLLSVNIASAQAAGYKGKVATMSGIPAGKIHNPNAFDEVIDGVFPQVEIQSDFKDGPMIQTKKPTDFAIQGSGFFQVESPDGNQILTRDGQFSINNKGILVNKQGFPVQGDGGKISIPEGSGSLVGMKDGRLLQDGRAIARLKLVNPDNLAELVSVNGGFFAPPEAAINLVEVEEPTLVQGFFEGSNLSPTRQMVEMIRVSKAYENNQKMIQTLDDRFSRAIQVLGNTTQ